MTADALQAAVLSAVINRRCSKIGSGAILDYHSVVELNDPIGNVVEMFVVTDDQYCLAPCLQFRKYLVIENVLELGILVRRPLVEKVNVAVFQEGRKQGQSLALAL